jgi:prolyl 4-hydroxylase
MDKEILSEIPLVVYFHNVLTDEECDNIITAIPEEKYELSSVGDKYGTSIDHDHRTGFNAYHHATGDCISFCVSDLLTREGIKYTDRSTYEQPSTLKYNVGDQFKKHFDYFNTGKKIIDENDRIATALLYLNDDYEGGETDFPVLGFTVKPRKGSVLYWQYDYTSKINANTLHAGLPVTKGTKYATTTWMRESPYTG